jgi:hypothetical protein
MVFLVSGYLPLCALAPLSPHPSAAVPSPLLSPSTLNTSLCLHCLLAAHFSPILSEIFTKEAKIHLPRNEFPFNPQPPSVMISLSLLALASLEAPFFPQLRPHVLASFGGQVPLCNSRPSLTCRPLATCCLSWSHYGGPITAITHD